MKTLFFYILSVAAIIMAEDTDIEEVFRTANNQFTARMFNEVIKENKGKSVVLSAFSVMPPLAQLALASVGESHDELLKNIGLPNDNYTKAAFTRLNSQLKSSKGIELRMANNIYIPETEELNNEFAAVSKNVFNSGVQKVDFKKNVETAASINAWVEDQTNHRIKDLVTPDSFTPATRAVLVNAIYFKGSWKDQFNKHATYDGDFHVSMDKVIKVPTMYNKGDYRYGESEELDAKMLEIPYEGETSSFLIVLPNKIDGINQLEQKLQDPLVFDRIAKNMRVTEVEIHIPKFKIETTTDLKKVLQNMDIKRLFSPGQARLDNLLQNSEDLYVSEAIQKAFIEINEEGAEAAAANAFGIVATSLVINEPPIPVFRADKPFYFVIKMKSVPLFNGVKIVE